MTPRSSKRSDRGYLLTLVALVAVWAVWTIGGSTRDREAQNRQAHAPAPAAAEKQPAARPSPVIRLVAIEEESAPLPGADATAPAALVPQGPAVAPLAAPHVATPDPKIAADASAVEVPAHNANAITLTAVTPAPPAAVDKKEVEKPTASVVAIRFAPESVAGPAEEPASTPVKSRSAIPGEAPCPLQGEIGFGRIDGDCGECDDASLRDRIRAAHEAHHPRYFFERPFGTYVRAAMNEQINNGLADQMVLYHYDFRSGDRASELTYRGKYQLSKFAARLFRCGVPIVVEETPATPALADARRQSVIDELKLLDPEFNLAESSVQVGRPRVPGLRGLEAQIVDDNNLQQTQARGTLGPGADANIESDSSVPVIP